MSHIKPTGSPGLGGVDPLGDAATASATRGTAPAAHAAATAATQSPSDAVVTALRAGHLTPDEAVRQLTELAVQRAGVPATMRPHIEARMRDLLATDPTLGGLLRRMGAAAPEE